MDKICPMMSRTVLNGMVWEVSEQAGDLTSRFVPTECQREKCQLWVEHIYWTDDLGELTGPEMPNAQKYDRSHCGLIKP